MRKAGPDGNPSPHCDQPPLATVNTISQSPAKFLPDPFRQMTSENVKNLRFPRAPDPLRHFSWRAEGGRSYEMVLDVRAFLAFRQLLALAGRPTPSGTFSQLSQRSCEVGPAGRPRSHRGGKSGQEASWPSRNLYRSKDI